LERRVPKTVAVGQAALEDLLRGPQTGDVNNGYFSAINPGVVLNKLTIENGVAKADFNDLLNMNVAGSCRVAMIRAQITQTLKQFPTVKSVVISVNGATDTILQP
jgi:spore germination protein GerM